jgi:hypothetical protein
MCKLCNSDREPVLHYSSISKRSLFTSRLKDSTIDDLCIIREYIGESICHKCRIALIVYLKKYPSKTVDDWVVNRLYLFYSTEETRAVYVKANRRKKELQSKREQYIGKRLVEPYISLKLNTNTFLVSFNGYGRSFSRSFRTLQEAQQFKQEILNG